MLFSLAKTSLARRTLNVVFFILSTPSLITAQVPDAADFIRRNNHGTVSVGNFVYIDGGLYSKYVDGEVWGPFPNTKTLAIDMRTSWTNKTVKITEISKGNSPVFFQPQYWPDESSDSFYSWSGGAPSGYPVSEKSLWKFTGDGKGGGSWARQSISDSDGEFKNLTRPVGGYSAVVDGVGYYVGGYATGSTDDINFEGSDMVPVPGVVSYNFSSGAWSNDSSSGWSQYGTGMRGQAAAVPFGNDGGLLVLLGGESGTRESVSNQRGYMDFSSVTIYDTANGSWYSQTTTGEAPSTRDEFCMAAAQGEHSTELLVFGGWTVATGLTHNDSYILSLPAFHWFKGPTDTSPRVGLSCHPVGSGRQVLVIGGQDNNNNTYRWENPDPWTQGLGIFDMTAMEWSDGYDADAGVYESPQVVKDWYADNSNAELEWSSDTVRALFSRTTTTNTSTSASGSATTASYVATSSAAVSPEDDTDSTKSSTGAIAGGVIGGIAGLALMGLAIFFWRRRKGQENFPGAAVFVDEMGGESKVELHGYSTRAELPTKVHERTELPGDWPRRAELPVKGQSWHERPVELPTIKAHR
ncbi:hypothetical protein B0J12DRAFT_290870 [Macrophomina phaseolina]|uniref:Galactose oxidase/kelch beta-propeller n=1 Tax=Macrophomina phaseolina TaxID=35725 RepID=A0ABQ8GNJ3_9PEZI|nr:hypothetical protein B0J12DRAFT_290870 [Macrophomina phaseolina]